MRKEQLHHDDIFLIRDFFTPEECAEHIRRSEEAGYDDAPISTGRGAVVRKDVRNNDRVMIDDPTLAAVLFARAEPFLPPNFLVWKAVGLNERFRYYRYTKGAEVRLALRRRVHPPGPGGVEQADVHGLLERRVRRRGDGVQLEASRLDL